MKQSTLESKKSGGSWEHGLAHHAAIHPTPSQALPRVAESGFGGGGWDLSQVPVNSPESASSRTSQTQSCPFAPQRCPFGGACHTCPPRVQTQPITGIQRKAANNDEFSEVPPIVHEVLRSPGQPLDGATRAFFEPRFGHDFGQVRVHSDVKSAESARAVNASAFTVGRDVVFGSGQYSLGTNNGRKLLAHELAHTIQQGNAIQYSPAALQITSENDPFEREAEKAAADVAQAGRAILPTPIPRQTIARQKPAAGSSPEIFVHNTELGGLSVGNFDFHFRNCAIIVWVWVKFKFTKDINSAEQAAYKTRFIDAVHNVWAHPGYSLSGGAGCPCGTVPIEVHVEETGGHYHKLVDVERKTDEARRPKVISDININYYSSEETIAHEFGHVLGLYDEYDGGFFENIMFWHKNQKDPFALMSQDWKEAEKEARAAGKTGVDVEAAGWAASQSTDLRPRYFEHYRKQVQSTAPKGCQYIISSTKPPVP